RHDGQGVDIKAPPDVAARVGEQFGCTFLGVAGGRPSSPPAGADLPSRLFPWQREAAMSLVAGKKYAVWFACGLGKSATLLAAAHMAGAVRVLAVTRAIGRDVFARDAVWAAPGKRVGIVIGQSSGGAKAGSGLAVIARRADKRLDDLRAKGADCFVCTSVADAVQRGAWMIVIGWEVLAYHVDTVSAWKPDLAIFDEAHCCKGRGLADRAKAAFRIARATKCVVWESTATPVIDRLRDLWAQLALIDARAWGSSWAFVHRYCAARPGRHGGLDTTGRSNTDELRDRLKFWVDARTRDEIKHLLPAKLRSIHRVKPGREDGEGDASASVARGVETMIARAADAKIGAVIDRVIEALV
ncbi:MAG: SNF2-related protein, partial [Dehalococcoidia bacterium]|nr:SNF2-related protein [Dehalococcoidia bacterium]